MIWVFSLEVIIPIHINVCFIYINDRILEAHLCVDELQTETVETDTSEISAWEDLVAWIQETHFVSFQMKVL